jgi:hypothetical protein
MMRDIRMYYRDGQDGGGGVGIVVPGLGTFIPKICPLINKEMQAVKIERYKLLFIHMKKGIYTS